MVMDMIMCMNLKCHCTESYRWITGWALKNGAFARLCFVCGSAYEGSRFCETFHKDESGWRNCRICGKPIHCGCIASKHTHEYLDLGGVWCKICENRDAEQCARMISIDGIGNRSSTIESSPNGSQPSDVARNKGDTSLGKGNIPNSQDPDHHISQTVENTASSPVKQQALISDEGTGHTFDRIAINVGNNTPQTRRSSICSMKRRITREENAQVVEQAQKSYKPHLLAKHMPKVSNEELQQMFGALNSTVTPLFEKVLSVSDVSKVGRLIIPKVCAVTYFPHLTEASGIPMDVLDSNGKNWKFQLRYWNNIRSRMYVFENVQDYICEMALEATDTVIFGMIHTNKVVIGFKKIPRDVQIEDFEITWAQAQDMLQPDPESVCDFVMIDGYPFEVYDKPPIMGNKPESTTLVPGPSSSVREKRVKTSKKNPQPPDLKKAN